MPDFQQTQERIEPTYIIITFKLNGGSNKYTCKHMFRAIGCILVITLKSMVESLDSEAMVKDQNPTCKGSILVKAIVGAVV